MNNDYINRAAVMERTVKRNSIWNKVTNASGQGLEEIINDIPSADVAPVRHGRWVESFKVNASPTLRSRWTCSWCGNVQTYGATDYCPNCGARMDGESDE